MKYIIVAAGAGLLAYAYFKNQSTKTKTDFTYGGVRPISGNIVGSYEIY